jgi:hypothetical protein
MLNRRGILALLTSAGLVVMSGTALAKKKIHKSGKNLLGAKIKRNGKHQIDKVGKGGKAKVDADVKDGKVASMSIIDAEGKEITGKKVKTKNKMAEAAPHVMNAAASSGLMQLAQLDWYYGWYFDYDDYDYYYWYPADEVYWEEDDWYEWY